MYYVSLIKVNLKYYFVTSSVSFKCKYRNNNDLYEKIAKENYLHIFV